MYIHIPFCRQKCAYCDFCSYPGREGDMESYTAALVREIRGHARRLERPALRTLYIGGGTPTTLSAQQLKTILGAVRECFECLPGMEATVEANPGTLTEEKLEACVEGGVNRLSMGMQALQPRLLRMLGRIHDFDQVCAGVQEARRAGIDNVSVDLMYALPGQTPQEWRASLRAALELGVEHVSCYELTLEEGTPIFERVQRGELRLPDEDECLEMARIAREETKNAGMHRYEISNYARKGFESRHNEAYWLCRSYIGAGCAAHGYDAQEGVRYANTSDLTQYLKQAEPERETARLTPAEARFERLMLGLRMIQGMDTARFERDFCMDVHTAFGKNVARLIAQGFLQEKDGFLSCTERGLDVQNTLLCALMDDFEGEM